MNEGAVLRAETATLRDQNAAIQDQIDVCAAVPTLALQLTLGPQVDDMYVMYRAVRIRASQGAHSLTSVERSSQSISLVQF